MEIYFWGTRGSISSPGPSTVKYGGNTTCVEIRDGEQFIIIDAGTGIRECGNRILKERGPKNNIHMLITHTHWDHIQGFPFFTPIFIPGNFIQIIGPAQYNASFETIMKQQMQYSYFPVEHHQLSSEIIHKDIMEGTFEYGGFTVTSKALNHPVRTLAYRLEKDGKSIVFLTDSEPYSDVIYHGIPPQNDDELHDFEEIQAAVMEQNERIMDFCRNADILVIDAQYTQEEYPSRIGFGHTPMETAIEMGIQAKVRNLVFFHHDPSRTDAQMDELLEKFHAQLSSRGGHCIENLYAASEGSSIQA
jgi:phosphoribosyl 1,2-cyclic phosphodiesterase